MVVCLMQVLPDWFPLFVWVSGSTPCFTYIMYTSTTIHAHVYLQTYTCTQYTPDISTWRLMEIRGSDACSTSGHGRFDGRSGAAGNRIRRSWALGVCGRLDHWSFGRFGVLKVFGFSVVSLCFLSFPKIRWCPLDCFLPIVAENWWAWVGEQIQNMPIWPIRI